MNRDSVPPLVGRLPFAVVARAARPALQPHFTLSALPTPVRRRPKEEEKRETFRPRSCVASIPAQRPDDTHVIHRGQLRETACGRLPLFRTNKGMASWPGATKPVHLRPDGLRAVALRSSLQVTRPPACPFGLASAARPQGPASLGLAPRVRLRRTAGRPAVVTFPPFRHSLCISPQSRPSRQARGSPICFSPSARHASPGAFGSAGRPPLRPPGGTPPPY